MNDNNDRKVSTVRSIVNYTVGVLIFFAGVFLLLNEPLKISDEVFPPTQGDKIFGILCISYGFWRVYRGVKKTKLQ